MNQAYCRLPTSPKGGDTENQEKTQETSLKGTQRRPPHRRATNSSRARVYAKKNKIKNQYHEENWILSTSSLSSKGLPENKIALRVV